MLFIYLFIACFDLKIGVFQQTVATVYYIFNYNINTMNLNIFDKNQTMKPI